MRVAKKLLEHGKIRWGCVLSIDRALVRVMLLGASEVFLTRYVVVCYWVK